MSRGTKTTEFLKECMCDALIKLIPEKNFDKITVNDITTLAGVGRSTWFRNFTTKMDALTYKLVRMWQRWAKERHLSEYKRYNLDNAKDFFQFNYGIRDLINTIYKAELQSCIYDAFCVVMMPQYEASAFECYQSRFYAYGLFGLLEEWVKRGFKETPEKMTDLFYKVMDNRPDFD
ncbi:MAG: TetR-like C-terminal domain-containing protein [Acutalibacteraceae bacterium]|nr:TetR-like C-terminal domain-containing protein [Acutalibacteraceae bacterium]